MFSARILISGWAALFLGTTMVAAANDALQLRGDDLAKLRWRALGPGSMGGRIVDLAVLDDDPSTYYVGTASGGIFKTVNRGITFEPIFDDAGAPAIGDLCVAPADTNIVWAGTGEHNGRNSVSWGDGVYKSTDSGKTWRHMGLRESFQIGRIAIHPKDANTVFVGALGRLWGPNEQRGLYKTTDGGETWRKVLHIDDKTGCIDVAISPADPSIMLAAMYERQRDAFDGGDPAKRWGPGSGLFKSSDGGETWIRLTKGLPTANMGRIGIGWSRQNPDTIYTIIETEHIGKSSPAEPEQPQRKPAFMGISGGDDAEGGGARIAEVIRGGPSDEAGLEEGDIIVGVDEEEIGNYQDLIAQIRRHAAGDAVTLKVARGGDTVDVELTYGERPVRGGGGGSGGTFAASLGGQQANVQDRQGKDGFQTGGVFKSEDGGETWKRVNSLNPRPFYYSQIHVDPTDDNHVYVLGIALHMSSDGGKTFRTTGRGVHPDHHAMWIDPGDGEHLVLGCDGGLYVTYDRTRTWEFIRNLPIGQFYDVTVDTKRLYNIYGGLQDNGSWGGPSAARGSNGPTADDWFPVGGGDGFVCKVDPEDPDIVYYESQYGRMARINIRTGERHHIRPEEREEGGPRYRFNWKTPFLLSNHNPRIFYAAGNFVFRSLDRGEKLQAISPQITTTDRGSATALAESPLDSNLLYVGTDDGQLWVTRNGGHEWTNIRDKLDGVPGPRRVSSIEASRDKPGRVYLTLDGHYYDDDAAYVQVSEDYGETWQSLRANLPATAARTLREDIQNPAVLYLGTEFGAWVSLDRGGSWHKFDNNMPPVAVHEFAQHAESGELIAGTHGRGIWIADVVPLRQAQKVRGEQVAHLFEPLPAVLWGGFQPRRRFGHKYFVGENPDAGAVIYYLLDDQTEKAQLRILDGERRLVRELEAATGPGLHRATWDLRRARDRRERQHFGSAVTDGRFRLVLEVDEVSYSVPLRVERDPEIPEAPTLLQLEEEAYEQMMNKMKSLELTD